MFCMVMFIHPKHGTFLRLSLRLISHWKHFAPPGSSRIGNEPPLQAHSALDNSPPVKSRDARGMLVVSLECLFKNLIHSWTSSSEFPSTASGRNTSSRLLKNSCAT